MSERWQQIKTILQLVLDRPYQERDQYLRNVCGDNHSPRREITNQLASSENIGNFLEQPAISKVAEMFVGDENKLQMNNRLNHYRILTKLGAGGMGEVYLAEDTKLNRFVAVKLLPQSLSSDHNANRLLLREAQSAAALDHPHICQIHEIAETEHFSFIVMQFCEGETLADKLENEKFSVHDVIDIAVQIADAIADAHSHHVIHRDIKPANIIVNKKGQAKILDFGLAKITAGQGKPDENETPSRRNIIVGTAPYMSPEQVRGELTDERSDIFSFGTIMYEMLAGKQLFKRDTQFESINAVLNYSPPIAQELAAAPPELQRIVRRILAKEKSNRYQTSRELLIDLQIAKKEQDFQFELERSAVLKEKMKPQIHAERETAENQPPPARYDFLDTRYSKITLGLITALIIAFLLIAGFWLFA